MQVARDVARERVDEDLPLGDVVDHEDRALDLAVLGVDPRGPDEDVARLTLGGGEQDLGEREAPGGLHRLDDQRVVDAAHLRQGLWPDAPQHRLRGHLENGLHALGVEADRAIGGNHQHPRGEALQHPLVELVGGVERPGAVAGLLGERLLARLQQLVDAVELLVLGLELTRRRLGVQARRQRSEGEHAVLERGEGRGQRRVAGTDLADQLARDREHQVQRAQELGHREALTHPLADDLEELAGEPVGLAALQGVEERLGQEMDAGALVAAGEPLVGGDDVVDPQDQPVDEGVSVVAEDLHQQVGHGTHATSG
jgi:hypothetical protein